MDPDRSQFNSGEPATHSGSSFRRRQVITGIVAFLMIVALLWLWLRPSSFGGMGGAARAGVFGRNLAGLATGDGRAPAGNPDWSSNTNNALANRNHVSTSSASAMTNSALLSPPRAARDGSPETTPAPVPATDIVTVTNLSVRPAAAPFAVRLNDDFSQRLSAAGAQTGDVQISLIWNNVNDLDLHCVDPDQEEIFFQHRQSRTGGILDVDRNAGPPLTAAPVENIYWANSRAPLGEFKVYVNYYAWHGGGDPTEYKVRILVRGQEMVFTGFISNQERKRFIHKFRLGPNQ